MFNKDKESDESLMESQACINVLLAIFNLWSLRAILLVQSETSSDHQEINSPCKTADSSVKQKGVEDRVLVFPELKHR